MEKEETPALAEEVPIAEKATLPVKEEEEACPKEKESPPSEGVERICTSLTPLKGGYSVPEEGAWPPIIRVYGGQQLHLHRD